MDLRIVMVVLFLGLLECQGNICPDHSFCPDDLTCCAISSSSYGCCPYPDGVCCNYKTCCPEDTVCVPGLPICLGKSLSTLSRRSPKLFKQKSTGIDERKNAKSGTTVENAHRVAKAETIKPENENVKDRSRNNACSESETRCPFGKSSYACCPYKKAVCCLDNLHCCPQATKCSTECSHSNRNVMAAISALYRKGVTKCVCKPDWFY